MCGGSRTVRGGRRRPRTPRRSHHHVAATVATPAADPRHREPVSTRLSHREREVTALVARGLSNREIAAALNIAEKTVANHVDHIMTKLELRSRTRIAVWAVEHGLDRTSAE